MSGQNYNNENVTTIIKNRIPLSEYISSFTNLEKKGNHFLGICPFHNEKTPSFTVNDEKGFFHCFGCSAHGDIFEFVMRLRNVQFLEALNHLAETLGIQFEKTKRENKLKKIYDALHLAKEFFYKKLFEKNFESMNAVEYLKSREIDFELIKDFQIGFSGGNGSELITHLLKNGVEKESIFQAGLIQKNNERAAFFKRIMFPIFNENGHVIAFGGRVIDKTSLPKYLNSAETVLFKKGETLYNFDKIFRIPEKKKSEENKMKEEIEKNLYITEGYIDSIMMKKFGFKNSLASLGTAITENQIELMWKHFDDPTICFDGDNAGMIASLRIINKILPTLREGKTLKIANLPHGFDPDNFLKKFGKEKMFEVLNEAKPIHEFIFINLLNNFSKKIEVPEFRIKFKKDLFEIAKKIKNNELSRIYKEKFSELYFNFFDKKKFKNNFLKLKKGNLINFQTLSEKEKILKAETLLLAGILIRPNILNFVEKEFCEIDFSNHMLCEIKNEVILHFYEKSNFNVSSFNNFLNKMFVNHEFDSIKIHIDFFLNENMSNEDYKNAWIEIFENTIKRNMINNSVLMIKKNFKIDFENSSWNELKILKNTKLNDE